MLAKASSRGSDALIVDFEDAIAPSRKEAAREVVVAWLRTLTGPMPSVWVRVNSTQPLLEEDATAVVQSAITGLVIPKVTSVGELEQISALLDRLEPDAGLMPGVVRLLPIIETAAGMLAVAELATVPRVHQLMIGEVDLGGELGLDPREAQVYLPMRMQVVIASAAAGIEPPLGPVSVDFEDLDRLRRETRDLRQQGFRSRAAIHPAQIPVLNEIFTPSQDEVERAQRLMALFHQAVADDRGVVLDENGQMVDEAAVRTARRIIETVHR